MLGKNPSLHEQTPDEEQTALTLAHWSPAEQAPFSGIRGTDERIHHHNVMHAISETLVSVCYSVIASSLGKGTTFVSFLTCRKS